MPDIIANIASFGKPKHCDFQRYSDLAISASFPRMEVIDGQWISARLTGRHCEKAKLAAAIGLSPHKLAKVLSGDRKVQAEEIPKITSTLAVLASPLGVRFPLRRRSLALHNVNNPSGLNGRKIPSSKAGRSCLQNHDVCPEPGIFGEEGLRRHHPHQAPLRRGFSFLRGVR